MLQINGEINKKKSKIKKEDEQLAHIWQLSYYVKHLRKSVLIK